MLYFAYGSNMDPRQIRQRCPTARFVSTAILPGYRIVFSLRSKRRRCGVANILPEIKNEVHGILFRINGRRDWDILDAAEGYVPDRERSCRYKRAVLKVYKPASSKPIVAWAYIGIVETDPPLPSAAYLNQMLNGAQHWGLPKAYQNTIEELLPR